MKFMNFTAKLFCIPAIVSAFIQGTPLPRVSIITSVYKDFQFRKRFLENITQQTIFDKCELLLIDATPSDNEDSLIVEYMKKHPNIKYVKLSFDPGVYGVWNLGVLLAQAPYLTNANLDDLRYVDCLERQANYLDTHEDISLVYADFKYSDDPKNDIDHCAILAHVNHAPVTNFKRSLHMCIPGPQPMWRKSIHTKVGLFNQDFLYSGDWEFWNRMVKAGLLFGQMEGYSGIYYYNPEGLSTNQIPEKVDRRNRENQYIINQYGTMWSGQE
ncbi:MAG TPA: glycosyltransferase [Patescibacteria group bacterium]|jgi:GT2 family glycosyltransferase|nr:glycosyltransferase [Patescibacteria group bacterium]